MEQHLIAKHIENPNIFHKCKTGKKLDLLLAMEINKILIRNKNTIVLNDHINIHRTPKFENPATSTL